MLGHPAYLNQGRALQRANRDGVPYIPFTWVEPSALTLKILSSLPVNIDTDKARKLGWRQEDDFESSYLINDHESLAGFIEHLTGLMQIGDTAGFTVGLTRISGPELHIRIWFRDQ